MKNRNVKVSLAVFFICFFAEPAFAYLDGGTGSMILQLILGGIAGIAVILKVFWNSILSKLGIRKENMTSD